MQAAEVQESSFTHSITDIAPAVQNHRDIFLTGRTKAIAWRAEQLKQIKKMMIEQESKLLEALKLDLNKCEQEAWTSEIGFVIGDVDHTLKSLKKWSKPRKVSTPMFAQPGTSYQHPDPLGTVLIIGAWNYPIQLVLSPLVAAIAAGNCVVLKPSELSEHCSKLLAELVPKYLDSDCISVVEGAVEETTELLKQRFDHILYTGGEGVAKIIMRAASEYLTPVTLELGGKSPCIVDRKTNLEVTASRIVWSKWMNAGQTCVAPDYVLVEKTFVKEFLTAIEGKIEDFYGGDAENSKDFGRIVNSRHFARLTSYLEGQNIVYGGKTNSKTNYMGPTIVLAPSSDSAVMQEEIFGPILVVVPVDNIKDSVSIINSKPKPLALYLYTKDSEFEQQVMLGTSAGNVGVNDGMMFMANPDLPFGGVGSSGMGSYHGQAGFDTFSHLKTVMKRSFLFDVALRYPPFSSKKLNILKKLL